MNDKLIALEVIYLIEQKFNEAKKSGQVIPDVVYELLDKVGDEYPDNDY